jgi:hypothetical protein
LKPFTSVSIVKQAFYQAKNLIFMDVVFDLIDLYFRIGLSIVAINLLIGRARYGSFSETIFKEAIRSGMPADAAQKNSAYKNIVYSVVAWPAAVCTMLLKLINY